MDTKAEEAHQKLKNMALFTEDFKGFEAMFFDLMTDGKEKEALAFVLKVTFKLLKSEGEVFNEVLALVDAPKAKELKTWIHSARRKHDK